MNEEMTGKCLQQVEQIRVVVCRLKKSYDSH
jgi:hypothetical protein